MLRMSELRRCSLVFARTSIDALVGTGSDFHSHAIPLSRSNRTVLLSCSFSRIDRGSLRRKAVVANFDSQRPNGSQLYSMLPLVASLARLWDVPAFGAVNALEVLKVFGLVYIRHAIRPKCTKSTKCRPPVFPWSSPGLRRHFGDHCPI